MQMTDHIKRTIKLSMKNNSSLPTHEYWQSDTGYDPYFLQCTVHDLREIQMMKYCHQLTESWSRPQHLKSPETKYRLRDVEYRSYELHS